MKLYLVRHGETQMNVDKLYYGWTDCPLNEKGVEQAKKLQSFFDHVEYDKVISSDLARAVKTAEILNQNNQKPMEKREVFRELNFGIWEGKNHSQLKEEFPEEFPHWLKNWNQAPIPQGETYSQFYERVTNGLKNLIEEEVEDSSIVLVVHNGAISAILCALTGAGKDSFWRFYAEQGTYCAVSIYKKKHILIEKINCPV